MFRDSRVYVYSGKFLQNARNQEAPYVRGALEITCVLRKSFRMHVIKEGWNPGETRFYVHFRNVL